MSERPSFVCCTSFSSWFARCKLMSINIYVDYYVRKKNFYSVSSNFGLLWRAKYTHNTTRFPCVNPNLMAHCHTTTSWTSKTCPTSTTSDIPPSASCNALGSNLSISESASHAAVSAPPTNFQHASHLICVQDFPFVDFHNSQSFPPSYAC